MGCATDLSSLFPKRNAINAACGLASSKWDCCLLHASFGCRVMLSTRGKEK